MKLALSSEQHNSFAKYTVICLTALLYPVLANAAVGLQGSNYFGVVVVGAPVSQLEQLTNQNTTTLTIGSISTNGSEFTQTNNCGSSLMAGASCTIIVTFRPGATGNRTGPLVVTDSDSTSPQSMTLSGVGTAVAFTPGLNGANSSAGVLAFGSQNVFTISTAMTVQLTNVVSAPLNFVNIIASGDFSQSNTCGSTLPGHSSCTITVVFTPTAAGARTGYVEVGDTDPTKEQAVILSGTGQTPTTTVSVRPRVASVTFAQTQQFQAWISGIVSSNVTWTVDSITGGNTSVGTISSSGVYSPPTNPSLHIVTAINNSDRTQSAISQVVVTNFGGAFTYQYDNARTGQNLLETVLTTGNVNPVQFGKLFSFLVDGQVYAQPLYVPNVNIPGQGSHNVIYVATEHDSVYAFDADGLSSVPLWYTKLVYPPSGYTTVPCNNVADCTITPEIGITSTPVIDPANNVLFVLTLAKDVTNGVTTYEHRIHSLDIRTGAETRTSTVVFAALPGTGDGSNKGYIQFNPITHGQRPALLLVNGIVYIAWASHGGDVSPYHGWVIGYDEALRGVTAWMTSPNGSRAGIWQSGAGLAADQNGNIYLISGNGTFDVNTGGVDYGDSFVKLGTTSGLAVADYFTPYNQDVMNSQDLDFGSGGPLLLPDQPTFPTHLTVGCGKLGTIYLVNRDNMGQYNPNRDQIVQELVGAVGGTFSSPSYWQNAVYFLGSFDNLKSFRLYNGQLSFLGQGAQQLSGLGATLAVSANGSTNGIVWAIDSSAWLTDGPAVLRAYDASRVYRELYDSAMAGTRDSAGLAVRFTVPMVANGKVYVGAANELDAYGLLP
jgi:hypothetical protein